MQINFEDPQFRKLLEELVSQAVARFVAENELKARELSLVDRLVRVEEEIKSLREVMYEYMKLSDQRFETIERANQQRFEAMEKRLEALQREMDARFQALQRKMDTRFEAMDKRFEAMERANQQRFEALDKRFEAIEKRLSFLQWFMGLGFTFIASLIGIATYLLAY